MKSSLAAVTALLLNSLAMPAVAAQTAPQPAAAAPALDRDAQCAMFMRNVSVAMLVRGNLTAGERSYLARYGVLFAYYAGRFSIGHDQAAALPVLTATVRGLSREVQDRMDCFNDGERATRAVQAQLDRAVPAPGSRTTAAVPAAAAPAGAPAEDARCVAAVQRVINERDRLIARPEMGNPDRIFWTVDYLTGRIVARDGAAAFEPAVAAAFTALPADVAAADAMGFRCVDEISRARDAFSDGIAAAEQAAHADGGGNAK